MPNPVVAIAGGSAVSGIASASAAKKGADAQADAAKDAAKLQNQQYQQTRKDLMPYTQAGYSGLSDYDALTTQRGSTTRPITTTTTETIPGTSGGSSGGTYRSVYDKLPNNSLLKFGVAANSIFKGGLDARIGSRGGSSGSPQRTVTTSTTTGGRKGLAPTLRDPNDYRSDPLYSPYKSRDYEKNYRVNKNDGKLANDYRISEGQFGNNYRVNKSDGQLANKYRVGTENFNNSAYDIDIDMSDFEESPGYQYRLEQGQKAINRRSAAQGNFFSGATGIDLMRHNQGMAADEFQNEFGRRATNAQMGLTGRNAYNDMSYRNNAFNYGAATDDYNRNRADNTFNYGLRTDDWTRAKAARTANYGMASDDYNRNRADNSFNFGLAQNRDNRLYRDANYNYGQKQDAYGRNLANWRYAVDDAARKVSWGQSAAGQTANAGQSAASNSANALLASGRARADGYNGMANSLSNSLGSAMSGYGMYKGGAFGANPGGVFGKWGWT